MRSGSAGFAKRSPSTTISATSGQTVVLSGLLTKRTFDIHRRVPLLADVPLIGDLFRYDAVQDSRTELLIIMTPRILRSDLDMEMLKQVESSRMSWVLSDVIDLHGPAGLRTRGDAWDEVEGCYPTEVPMEELQLSQPSVARPATGEEALPSPVTSTSGVEPASFVDTAAAPRRLPSTTR